MPDTADLQAALAAALCADDVAQAEVSAFLGAPARVRRRLGFYRGNVQANARKALRNAYPVCVQIVGEPFFDNMADRYAARSPSESGDLNEYGETFAAFVAAFAPAAQVPYLAAVAELEWRVHRAHYAADVPPMDLRSLAAIPPASFEALRVALHPACAAFASTWAIASIWTAHQPGHPGDFDVDPAAGPERALVYRPSYRVEVDVVAPGPFAFLEACAADRTLGEAVGLATAAQPDFALDAHLAGWVRDRVVVGLALP